MAKKMESGQTQTLKEVLHYMKPYRFFLLLSVILAAITVASDAVSFRFLSAMPWTASLERERWILTVLIADSDQNGVS